MLKVETMNIQSKLLYTYLLVSIIPLIILSSLAYFNASRALIDQAQDQMVQVTRKTLEQMDAFMSVCSNNTAELSQKSISSMAFLLDEFDEDLSSSIDRYKTYIAQRPYINQIKLIKLDGTEILSTLKPGLNKAIDESKYAWFKSALASDDIYISDMYTSEDTGVPVVTMAAPVIEEGRKKGIIALDIEGRSIVKYVDEVKTGKTGYGYVINESGFLIAHPEKEKILVENHLSFDLIRAHVCR